MNTFETVWDCTIPWTEWDSVVQRFRTSCFKTYLKTIFSPEQEAKSQLETYHKYQNGLAPITIDTTRLLDQIEKIELDFLRLPSSIADVSFLYWFDWDETYFDTQEALCVQLPYIQWETLYVGNKVSDIIESELIRHHPETKGFFHPVNFKKQWVDNRTLSILCTDVSNDISYFVKTVLR